MSFWKRFSTNCGAVVGLILLIAIIAIAIFAPMLYPRGPWPMVQRPFLAPFTTEGLPLGTDTLGRDVMAGLVYGARVSLLVGLTSTAMALLIGVPLGAVAGFYGNWVDEGAMRFTEFFQTIPNFALAIVLVAIWNPRSIQSRWPSPLSAGRPLRVWSGPRSCRSASANMSMPRGWRGCRTCAS